MTADTTHVKVVLTADARPYERALAGAARSASAVDNSMAKVKTTTDKANTSADAVADSVKEIGEQSNKASLAATALGTAISFIGAKAIGALQQAVAAASDFNETVSKMHTVFGEGAGDVEKFFANSAKDFGLSTQAAYDAATGIASMGKAAGLSGSELAKFSGDTVALAADLASFYNAAGGAEEVIYALSSAMRGEYESARRYNILLDDMTLRQRALTMGIVETTKLALTPQQKVLAVQAELFAQTSDAQGDYAKTADGLANTQRTLAAEMANARVELGEHLLPIMLAGTNALMELVDWFNGLSDGAQRAIAYLAAGAAAITLLGPPIRGLLTLFTLYRGAAAGMALGNLGIAGTAAVAATGMGLLAANVLAVGAAFLKIMGPVLAFLGAAIAVDEALAKLDKGDTWWGKLLGLPTEGTVDAAGPIKNWIKDLVGLGDAQDAATETTDKARVEAEKLQAQIQAMADEYLNAAGASDTFAASQGGVVTALSAVDQGIIDLMGTINAHIDAQQALMSTGDNMLGMGDRLRASAKQTATARGGGSNAAATKAETEALNKATAAIRKKENAEAEAEIKRARRAAERKAERRADREAREDARAGAAAFIEADKKAKRGEVLTEDDRKALAGEAIGEREGKLTKGESKALDSKIEGIRKKHQKQAEAQIKTLKDTDKATRSAGGAMEYYNTTLDKNTEAGRRNRAAFSAEIDSIQARATAVYQAAIDAGKGIPEASRLAQAEFDKLIGKLEDTGVEAGYARDDVKALIREMGLTPDVIRTIFTMTIKPEMDSAAMKKIKRELKGLEELADGLGDSGSAAAARIKEEQDRLERELANEENQRNFSPADVRKGNLTRAGGGEVYGPGGPTADKVPLWASAGEYVVNASQYAANRDLVRAINAGNGRVAGGMNIGSVTVNETTGNRVRMSVIDALAESAYRSGAVR